MFETNVTLDGTALTDEVGTTDKMCESGDQGEEESDYIGYYPV